MLFHPLWRVFLESCAILSLETLVSCAQTTCASVVPKQPNMLSIRVPLMEAMRKSKS